MKRITPESVSRLVAIYAARAGLTGRKAPAVDWTFAVSVAPGLSHPGEDGKPVPAWAVVNPKVNRGKGPYPGGAAHVQVRDIDVTPIPGFDGDPMFEIRVTIAHEMLHAVVAEAIAAEGGSLTVPAEEQIVEAAAQAIVRSEGTTDARVMARAVGAIPSTLRTRIAASAGQRARGETMDPIDLILAAVEAAAQADDPKEALAALLGKVRAIKDGSAVTEEPSPDSDPGAEMPKPAADNPAVGARGAAEFRKRMAVIDTEAARARLARTELEQILGDQRKGAKQQLVDALRARLPADHRGLPAVGKRILAAGDYGAAKLIYDLAVEMAPEAPAAGRARGGDRQTAAPSLSGDKPPELPEELKGKDPALQQMWLDVATHEGVESANASILAPARARLARDVAQGRN